ncbi:PLP-dependent aminotransferase family protein [Allopusillimonas ginsengisoli]|uniref:MocR-like pyridoxine biosynthesis transcription factor PdxR n=1 Tax=Allopusillimonas ginsengisoli TaxID=453575 RepID=UPI0010203C02|nr:PLP-dependent aminotransferase family protein [Allopusillimonas ginsengisoli]TEA78463.1 PLP-dependent aminotransferase family protein [Allopusillimonas ginsengisoli]
MKPIALADWLQQWLNVNSGEPAYRQLYRLLRQAMLDGRLPSGTRLPSSRELARDLSIARNTVIQVYEQLAVEGYVSAATGRGTFVEDISQDTIDSVSAVGWNDQAGPAGQSSRGLSTRARRLIDRLGFSRRQYGAFMAGLPDVAEFPAKTWLRLQNKHWRNSPGRLLSYAEAGGYAPLRQAISAYLYSSRSVNSNAEQVVVTTGIHQALDVATRLLCDIGDTVWIEDPSYWGLRNLLISSGLKVEPIAVDAEGIRPSRHDLRHPPKLIVVTPSHQYPLGMVMSLARRRMLLDYASKHGCWIIEDDYDSDFRYESRPLPSLQGLDSAGLVLYVGSFSKTMYPGLRIGYMVVPERMAEAFASALAELYREGQMMTQAIVAEFVREGYLSSHVRRVRNLYAQRRALLIDVIRSHYGDSLEIVGDEAGLHLVLALPEYVDDLEICRQAFERGITVRPLSDYYLHEARIRRGLLLGYAQVPPEQIEPAFKILASVVDAQLSMRKQSVV